MIDTKKHGAEIGRALRLGKFERTPAGILIGGGMNALVNGAFKDTLYRGGERDISISPNIVLDEWLIFMLNVMFNGASPITAWYVGLFSGNVTPAGTLTGAALVGTLTELTGYTITGGSETNRPAFTTTTTATKSLGNTGSEALFNFDDEGPYTARGAFIAQAQAKGAVTGKAVAATRFAADRTGLALPDKLGVEYIATAADAG